MKIFAYILITFLSLQVKGQTSEIDSLNNDKKKIERFYDSCSRKWQNNIRLDTAERWDAYVCMKYWQKKFEIISSLIEYKKDIWLKDRLKRYKTF